MSEALWLLIDRFATVLGILTGVLSLTAALWAWFERNDLKRWFRRNSFGAVSQPLPDSARFDALVLPVSRADVPCWLIDTVKPARVALLASTQSKPIADEIAAYARKAGVEVAAVHVLPDADDAAAFRAQAAECVRRLRESGAARIAVDTTGGKVPMSLGLFMAAEETGATTLYVGADYDPALKTPRPGSQRLVAVTTPAV